MVAALLYMVVFSEWISARSAVVVVTLSLRTCTHIHTLGCIEREHVRGEEGGGDGRVVGAAGGQG